MAFGRLSGKESAPQPMHAINVTPLVDVMLVLVVIFILAAPMLAASLRVQLPQAQGTQPMAAAGEDDALLLEVDAQGAPPRLDQAVDIFRVGRVGNMLGK